MPAQMRNADRTAWTPDTIAKLRSLLHDGLSASEIASKLGHGFSRNAIIGKANRLGLSLKGQAGGSANAIAQRIRDRAAKPSRPARPRKHAGPQTPIPAKTAPLPMPRADDLARKQVHQLEANDCRWPVGESRDASFGYCGLQCREGSVYCDGHHARAYQPQKTRPR